MRIPPYHRLRKISSSLGSFVLGMVVGAALYGGIHAAKYEALYNQNGELVEQLEQYEQEIKKLNQYKNENTVIKTVLPRIEKERVDDTSKPANLDSVTETELKRRIKTDLSVFEGRSIYDIDEDARFARLLLDRKVYTGVYERDYIVEIKTVLVVDNTLRVWVSVRQRVPE